MNLNYIELINRFWQEVEMKDFLPSEACVYFRLLDVCNRLGWQNPFSLSNSRAVTLMAMNEKTFRAIRDRLGGRGLIEFRKGKKRESAPLYCFPEKTDEGWIFPWENFLAVKNTVKNTANAPVNDTANTTVNAPVNTPAYNKTKTKTIKSPNGDTAVPAQPEISLFAEEEKKSARRKPKAEKAPPTLEQIRQHFLAVDADKRLENWEASAALFFDTFNADGWINKRGRSVVERTKWESEANKWIFYREEQEKKNESNEARQVDKFDGRRGSEPAAEKRKGFKGSFQR